MSIKQISHLIGQMAFEINDYTFYLKTIQTHWGCRWCSFAGLFHLFDYGSDCLGLVSPNPSRNDDIMASLYQIHSMPLLLGEAHFLQQWDTGNVSIPSSGCLIIIRGAMIKMGYPQYSEYSQACLSTRVIPLSSHQFGKVVDMCIPKCTQNVS